MLKEITLAARWLWRELRAGELTLLVAAVVVAVAGVTTVSFFTDRVHAGLDREAGQLLGADLVIASDHALAPAYRAQALARGLAVAQVMRFPSMVLHGDASVLADVKAATPGYPLRGRLRIAEALGGPDRPARGIPAAGTAWADARLLRALRIAPGATIELGNSRLKLTAIVTQEPDVSVSLLSAAPRVLINEADLAATGLVQPGSRIRYRLLIAGAPGVVAAYRAWAAPRLGAGERIEGARDARPEVRSALERAEMFLALAALVSVIVAAAGTALAARRYVQRHLDGSAIMRCIGMRSSRLTGQYALQLFGLGLLGATCGCALGAAAQWVLARWLTALLAVQLPLPGVLPVVYGYATGLAMLWGFALPPLAALARVPPLRVLRRELALPRGAGLAGYVLGIAAIVGMIFWRAGSALLGAYATAGFLGTVVIAAAVTWLAVRMLGSLGYAGVAWRFGVANLRRRTLAAVVQTVALAIGIMALLTLTVIRGDLLGAWQRSLPPHAPNRFIVNVQPDQTAAVEAFFRREAMRVPVLHPMVRGRLVRVNGRLITAQTYTDKRARHLADREFNLSWASRMQEGNRLVAGRWWSAGTTALHQISLEEGIAERLRLKLGDRLTFDVAGTPVEVTVTSLRKVEWDSFKVNFFALVPPGLLAGYPTSYVTSLYVAPQDAAAMTSLVDRFPNLLVIDVAQVIDQIRRMMDQVAHAVQFVFLFTVLAGFVVLFAAMASMQDERLYQAALLRTLGASRGQLTRATLAEFVVAGSMAGLLAAAGASALGYALATRVLNLEYTFGPTVWLAGVLGGAAAITLAGYVGTRRVVRTPPLRLLRELA